MRKESKFHNSSVSSLAELQFEKAKEIAQETKEFILRQYRKGTIGVVNDPELDVHLSEADLKRLAKETKK